MDNPRALINRARAARRRADAIKTPSNPAPAPVLPTNLYTGRTEMPVPRPFSGTDGGRRESAPAFPRGAGRIPGIAPSPARPTQNPAPVEAGGAPEAPRAAAPASAGGHAIYRELMRSHDRMGTQHLK